MIFSYRIGYGGPLGSYHGASVPDPYWVDEDDEEDEDEEEEDEE